MRNQRCFITQQCRGSFLHNKPGFSVAFRASTAQDPGEGIACNQVKERCRNHSHDNTDTCI